MPGSKSQHFHLDENHNLWTILTYLCRKPQTRHCLKTRQHLNHTLDLDVHTVCAEHQSLVFCCVFSLINLSSIYFDTCVHSMCFPMKAVFMFNYINKVCFPLYCSLNDKQMFKAVNLLQRCTGNQKRILLI